MLYEFASNPMSAPRVAPSGPATSTPSAGSPAVFAPPAPPSPRTTIAGSSYTPDYSSLITSDPGYIAAENTTLQSNAAAQAKRREAMRAALIQYGGDLPAGFKDTYGDIDQATLEAARGNQNSVLARLSNDYSQGVERFRRGLSARGMLQSSETDYGSDQLNRAYGQERYDAGNAFASGANQAYGGYADVLGQNAQSLAGAIGQAESNVFSNPAYRPVAPSFADYDVSASGQYGQPVYRGEDGKFYDTNGNPFNPPSTSSVSGDWRDTTGTISGYSPGVAAEDLAYIYGGY